MKFEECGAFYILRSSNTKSNRKLFGVLRILFSLRPGEVRGTLGVGVKISLYQKKRIYIPLILNGPPVAKSYNKHNFYMTFPHKASDWNGSDSEGRKLGERPGLDKPFLF